MYAVNVMTDDHINIRTSSYCHRRTRRRYHWRGSYHKRHRNRTKNNDQCLMGPWYLCLNAVDRNSLRNSFLRTSEKHDVFIVVIGSKKSVTRNPNQC